MATIKTAIMHAINTSEENDSLAQLLFHISEKSSYDLSCVSGLINKTRFVLGVVKSR